MQWIAPSEKSPKFPPLSISTLSAAFTNIFSANSREPKVIQDRIAESRSAYEDLIENSQRRVRILETMALALYREWFVHFRFPGHEDVPRVSSVLGDVPKGWSVMSVKNILRRRTLGVVYREDDARHEGEVPVIDQSTNELLGFHDNEPDHAGLPVQPNSNFR